MANKELDTIEEEKIQYIVVKIGDEQYGIAFRSGDEATCKAIEDAVAELVKDGTYERIANNYPDIVNNLIFLQK